MAESSGRLSFVQPLRHAYGVPPPLVGGGFGSPRKVNGFARGSPTRGAVERSETERLYEGKPDREPLLNSTSPSALTRCHLPYRGEALAGRATSYWTPEVRQDAKGRALLTGAAASGQRSLSSCRWPRQRSTAASEILSFARLDESWPTCQWLPLWGSWRAQARLRGQGRCQTALTQR